MGQSGADCDGPFGVLVFALPALVVYALGYWHFRDIRISEVGSIENPDSRIQPDYLRCAWHSDRLEHS